MGAIAVHGTVVYPAGMAIMRPGLKPRIRFNYQGDGHWQLTYAWPCGCGQTHVMNIDGRTVDECLQTLRWRIL